MINYREILRLNSLGYSQRRIEASVHSSHQTVKNVLEKASAQGISWPLEDDITNAILGEMLSDRNTRTNSPYAEPDFAATVDYAGMPALALGESTEVTLTIHNRTDAPQALFCRLDTDSPMVCSIREFSCALLKKGAVYIPVAPRSDRMHTAPYFILSPEGIQQGFIPNQNQFLRHWSREEEPQGCFPPARIP